jgi:hypothetical protein
LWLGRDGKAIYRKSTGLTHFVQLLDAGSALVLRGQAPSTSRLRQDEDQVLIVETETGNTQLFAVPDVATP